MVKCPHMVNCLLLIKCRRHITRELGYGKISPNFFGKVSLSVNFDFGVMVKCHFSKLANCLILLKCRFSENIKSVKSHYNHDLYNISPLESTILAQTARYSKIGHLGAI